MGEWHLRDEYSSFRIPVDELCLIPGIALDDISGKLRERMCNLTTRYRVELHVHYENIIIIVLKVMPDLRGKLNQKRIAIQAPTGLFVTFMSYYLCTMFRVDKELHSEDLAKGDESTCGSQVVRAQ